MTLIEIPYPKQDDLEFNIRVGACRLLIRSGNGGHWVEGSYDDPSGQIPTKIIEQRGSVTLTQSREIKDLLRLFEGIRKYDLSFGRMHPFKMIVETGASENEFDLGGIPLTAFVLKHGAGRNRIDFSRPNLVRMESFELYAGAGLTELQSICNANFKEMRIDGGAASFRLDFTGILMHDASVKLNTGVCAVELNIPRKLAAKITAESVLGSIDADKALLYKSGVYFTPAADAGNTPLLSIEAAVSLGALKIRLV